MNESIDIDIEAIKTEALRKIGRNISNLAKIEAGLKCLLSISSFEGPVQTFSEQFQINQIKDGKHSKKTLGRLVQEFDKDILVDGSQSEPTITFSDSEFYISVNFNVTVDDPNLLESYKSAFSDIVVERNKLIHQDLAFFDTSVESCREMISFLDEQNPRLLERLKDIRWMIEAIHETILDGLKSVVRDRLVLRELLELIKSAISIKRAIELLILRDYRPNTSSLLIQQAINRQQ